MDNTPEWTVGAEVIQSSHYGFGERKTVEKVYKTGNVVIGGKQHSVSGDMAYPTGRHYSRHRNGFKLIHDGNREAIAAHDAKEIARALAAALEKIQAKDALHLLGDIDALLAKVRAP